MIEPLDDELATCVRAYREIEQPTPAARAATWSAIAARLAEDESPDPRSPRLADTRAARWGALAAIAAALVLGLGLAGTLARRTESAPSVEAIHHSGSAPPHTIDPPAPAPQKPQPDPLLQSADSPPHDSPPDDPTSPDPPSPTDPSSGTSPAQPVPHAAINRPTTSRATSRTGPRPGGAPSLTPEEVASFQRAQTALAEGRHADALAALDAHGRRFPGGFFEEERLVSRATALCKLGRIAAARSVRDRFLAERPTSHLAERMRRICRENE